MTMLPLFDDRFGRIADQATREVLQEMALYISGIGASHLTSVGLSAPSGVFSVTGTPVTSKGTLALTFENQSANLFLASPDGASGLPSFRAWVLGDMGTQTKNTFPAGPATGANATPTWRALVNADLPAALAPATSIAVGTGTAVTGIKVYTPSLTPTLVAAASSAEQSFAVPGLTAADKLVVNGPSGAVLGNARADTGTLYLTFVNPTVAGATPPSGTYTVLAMRS